MGVEGAGLTPSGAIIVHVVLFWKELQAVEMMVFQEKLEEGSEAATMKPAPADKEALGLLSEPVVVLHSLSSSE